MRISGLFCYRAPVAQWIEYVASNHGIEVQFLAGAHPLPFLLKISILLVRSPHKTSYPQDIRIHSSVGRAAPS